MKGFGLLVLAGLGWLLLELVVQIFGELVLGAGWAAVRGAPSREPAHPALLAAAWGAAGLIVGALTILALPERVTPPAPVLGASLVLAPLLVGGTMGLLGRRWRERGRTPPQAFTFAAGATFAFAVSLVRFSHVVLGWPFGG